MVKVRVAAHLIGRKHYRSSPPLFFGLRCRIASLLSISPSSLKKFIHLFYVYVGVCVYCTLQLLTEYDPLVGVVGSWELPAVGAGN